MQINNSRLDLNLSVHEISILFRSLELEKNSLKARSSVDGNVAAMISEIDNIIDIIRVQVDAADKRSGEKRLKSFSSDIGTTGDRCNLSGDNYSNIIQFKTKA